MVQTRSKKKNKMPKLCTKNGLEVDALPRDLHLSKLEGNMIAWNIIFQKVHKKPKSRMAGTHGKLVNISINQEDVERTLAKLPRTLSQAGIINVNLKRRVAYKTSHLEQMNDAREDIHYAQIFE